VRVEDEVILNQPGTITWQIHTSAQVQLDQGQAVLSKKGKTARVQILSPQGAVFKAEPVHLAPLQLPLEGITRLSVVVSDQREAHFKLKFSFSE